VTVPPMGSGAGGIGKLVMPPLLLDRNVGDAIALELSGVVCAGDFCSSADRGIETVSRCVDEDRYSPGTFPAVCTSTSSTTSLIPDSPLGGADFAAYDGSNPLVALAATGQQTS